MIIGIPKKSIGFLAVLALIATYWINLKVVSILRPVDLMLFAVFAVLLYAGKIRKDAVGGFGYVVIISMIASCFAGLIFIERTSLSIRGFGLLFKYGELLLLFIILKSVGLDRDETKKLLIISLIVFSCIVVYIYARVVLITSGLMVIKGGIRPDFPFSHYGVEELQDARNAGHLVGSYVTTGTIAVIVYLLEKKKNIIVILGVLLFFLGAVLLTGSRSPIVAFILSLGIYFLSKLLYKVRLEKHKVKIVLFLVIMLVVVVGIIFSLGSENDTTKKLVWALQRSFRFDFEGDESVGSRLIKTRIGLENLNETGFLIGAGVFAYYNWFDNGMVRLLHDVGLIAFLILMFALLRFLRDLLRHDDLYSTVLLYMTLSFLVTNLITEFFLVPRGAFPFFLFLALLLRLRPHQGAGG